MQFTKFGPTGLTVSRMILGTGTFGKQTDEKEAHRMLDKAAEAGINFIDTADVYPTRAEAGGDEIIRGRLLMNKLGLWIRSCVRPVRAISACRISSHTVWQKLLDVRTR